MARSSWGSIYSDIIQQLRDETVDGKCKPDRITAEVLRYLAERADPLGVSFPNPETISDRVHYAVGSVLRSLQKCLDNDWVRCHITYNPVRRKKEVSWQLSPVVMYVRDELTPEALTLYDAGAWVDVMQIFTEKVYPEPESRTNIQNHSKSSSRNRTRNKTTTTTSNPISQQESEPDAASRPQGEGKTSDESQNDQREAQSKTDSAGVRRGFARPLVDVALCQAPLAAAERENLAVRLALRLPTTIIQARQLVASYDNLTTAEISTAMDLLAKEQKEGLRPKNGSLYGLLRYRIDCVGVDKLDSMSERKYLRLTGSAD